MINLVSYRGPSMPGGLSSSVGQAWNRFTSNGDLWWHLHQNTLQVLSHGKTTPKPVSVIKQHLINDHYLYCNEFLWPVLHGLEQYAVYVPEHHRNYNQFNQALASYITNAPRTFGTPSYFVHDYQLGLLPQIIKQNKNAKSVIFWHIPWPRYIANKQFVEPIKDLVKGMLGSEAIGFHTQEYTNNFMRFVEENLPYYICDWKNMSIKNWRVPSYASGHEIKILSAPLGIDLDNWSSCPEQKINFIPDEYLNKVPFIFSIDRGDYTKGIINRFEAINHLFQYFPEWRKKIRFIQVCTQTRPGIRAFDKYWEQCQLLGNSINQQWGDKDWQPLIWIQSPLSSKGLVYLYRRATAMLVNPIRDGLNLTAKEFIAARENIDNPGVLLLSPGAGAWHELGKYCIPVYPENPEQMACAINSALLLSHDEKANNINMLKELIEGNNLVEWWHFFCNILEGKSAHTKKEATKLQESALVPSNNSLQHFN